MDEGSEAGAGAADSARRATPHDPRIAVIGAGLAGLTTAYQLSQ